MLMQQHFVIGAEAEVYTRPAMLRTGTVGDITPNAAGYLLTGFDPYTYAYLDRPMSSGKWYWEANHALNQLIGVAASPATLRTYGGYSGENAGLYINAPWTGTGYGITSNTAAAASSTADVWGFAYDADTDTLSIYLNNTLKTVLSTPAAAIYAMFAYQFGPTQQVTLGPSCVFIPPAGYGYL